MPSSAQHSTHAFARVFIFATACAISLALIAGLISAGALAQPAPRPVVKITRTSEGRILATNRFRVRVKVRFPSLAKVSISVGAPGAKPRKASRPGKTKFKNRTLAVVKPVITTAGRKTLRSCNPKKIYADLEVTPRGGGRTVHVRQKVLLHRDLAECVVGSENPVRGPYYGDRIPTPHADRCDFLDTSVCLYPFPNNLYTTKDPGTPTGRRLDIAKDSMPINKPNPFTPKGVHMDPSDQNRGDGFSPGNVIIVKIPEVETQAAFDNSGFVPIDDLHRYKDGSQPVVVIDAKTGKRHPIWAEIDSNPQLTDPNNTRDVTLLIRPARNLVEGHRYIVALRGLHDAEDAPVEAPMAFKVYRDRLITHQKPIEARRHHMESLFKTLKKSGVRRSNLYMSWDFTVASEHGLSDRALQIRDDAFARLGDTNLADRLVQGNSPTFQIDSVDENPAEWPKFLRVVDGTITNIPCYLDTDGCPTGAKFEFDANGELVIHRTYTTDVPFRCMIPRSVLGPGPNPVPVPGNHVDQAAPGTYGHGLLGTRFQVRGQQEFSFRTNSLWCAMDFQGFADPDLGTVVNAMGDLSNFNQLADRMQQGLLNFMMLGRALIHPAGLNTDPAFQVDAGSGLEPVIDTSSLSYFGVSQGGIMGGALTALNPDVSRSVLNVPAINYSLLLRRSVDFDEYAEAPDIGLYANYPNQLERPLILSLMQLLWDRGEGDGYAQHMTNDPLPNTPSHRVLMQLAFGDHQVANEAAEVEARTIGASVLKPGLNAGRHWDLDPFMEMPAITSFPFAGSAMVYYDGGPTGFMGTQGEGSNTPPNGNIPPRTENGYGGDPHGYPRRAEDGMQHEQDFLYGAGINPCPSTGGYCYSNGWTGP